MKTSDQLARTEARPAERQVEDTSWHRVISRIPEEFAHGALLAIAGWLLSLPFVKLAKVALAAINHITK